MTPHGPLSNRVKNGSYSVNYNQSINNIFQNKRCLITDKLSLPLKKFSIPACHQHMQRSTLEGPDGVIYTIFMSNFFHFLEKSTLTFGI